MAISRDVSPRDGEESARKARLARAIQTYQRVGGLVVVPGLLRELAVDPAIVLPRAGIEPNALDRMENLIAYVSMGRLFHECALATDCPHFGLLAYQRVGLAHLGAPGELLRYSATLRAGLQRFVLYQHLNNGGMATFLLEDHGIASLGCAVFQPGVEFVDQIYDAFLAVACNVMRELWGPRWAPEEVFLSRAKPADVGAYRRFFRAPCRFDRERTALCFPAGLLDKPLPEADAERVGTLEQQAQAISHVELVSKLRRALRLMLLDGRSSAREVSALLSLHRRTLSRRLHDQGTSFQRILDEVRFETACQLLEKTRLPLTEIAASLGYSESSAFSRAFRRWAGAAPSLKRLRDGADKIMRTA
jgi:AraC-like DNA-binding protein